MSVQISLRKNYCKTGRPAEKRDRENYRPYGDMDRQITSEREGSNNSSPKFKIALNPWKKTEIPLSKDFFLLGWRKDASTLIRHSSRGISENVIMAKDYTALSSQQ